MNAADNSGARRVHPCTVDRCELAPVPVALARSRRIDSLTARASITMPGCWPRWHRSRWTPNDLAMAQLQLVEEGAVTVSFTPFDYITDKARVIVVGITPGRYEPFLARKAAQSALHVAAGPNEALRHACNTASFAGVMHRNLDGAQTAEPRRAGAADTSPAMGCCKLGPVGFGVASTGCRFAVVARQPSCWIASRKRSRSSIELQASTSPICCTMILRMASMEPSRRSRGVRWATAAILMAPAGTAVEARNSGMPRQTTPCSCSSRSTP